MNIQPPQHEQRRTSSACPPFPLRYTHLYYCLFRKIGGSSKATFYVCVFDKKKKRRQSRRVTSPPIDTQFRPAFALLSTKQEVPSGRYKIRKDWSSGFNKYEELKTTDNDKTKKKKKLNTIITVTDVLPLSPPSKSPHAWIVFFSCLIFPLQATMTLYPAPFFGTLR